MSHSSPSPGTRRSHQIAVVIGSSIWLWNGYQLATRFHAMSLIEGLTAGIIFLIAPVQVWKASEHLREQRIGGIDKIDG